MSDATDYVGLHARRWPAKLALCDLASGARWSYREFDLAIARCAALLASRGVAQGERVAALAKNHAALIVLHLACARLGAVYVPLNWRLSGQELNGLIADCEPMLVLGDRQIDKAGIAGVLLEEFMREAAGLVPLATPPLAPDRLSVILYTSGTSGRPKGVLLTERNLEQQGLNFVILAEVTNDSVFLSESPMFHTIGLVACLRAPVIRGSTILVSDGFEPPRTIQRIGDPALGITHYFAVPQMAAMLRTEPSFDPAKFRSLTALFSGGAPHAAAAIRAWLADGIAVADGFGMSETGTVSCMPLDREEIARRAGGVGVTLPSTLIRIVDEQDRDCAPDAPGELLVKGAHVTSGYWRRPAETRAAFTEDGFLRTGDIASRDENGFLRLIDRKKDMFISGGENVYPAEIEAALADHPDIAECAVVGVPDARWGEVGHLAVVLRPGITCLTYEAMIAHLTPKLARYKLPKAMSLHAALPRTGTGKLQKAALKALVAS